DLVVPVMRELQAKFAGKIKSASFDRSFHTPENQRELAAIVRAPCITPKGQQPKPGTVAFRQARQRHPGGESAIGALQTGNGLKRCRDRSRGGYERYGLRHLGEESAYPGEAASCRRGRQMSGRQGHTEAQGRLTRAAERHDNTCRQSPWRRGTLQDI